ncbi:MAG TPA: FAD-dependent oxidoreductase [Syntrophomonas sp.]|nr:FAD-dependent oxidoreductase [Syntrophomonas sp.]
MKIVIIGGMAAGPKTAARLRRLNQEAEITVIEQGEIVSFGACGMPFYLGNLIPRFDSLYSTSYGVPRDGAFFNTRKDITVLTGTRATTIDRENKRVSIVNLASGEERALEYDYLVLTTGTEVIKPLIKGVDLPGVFMLHNPRDAQRMQEYIRSHEVKNVAVIGAGVIGMEAADALAGRRLQVTVCEAGPQVLPKLIEPDIARLIERQMRQRKVDLQLECRVEAINAGPDATVAGITTSAGAFAAEAVLVATGVRPQVELARAAGLEIANRGAIKVDAHLCTSDPAIFAAGDCASQTNVINGQEVYIPLASTANKQGRVVADNIAGLDTEFTAVMGTTVLQAFDFNIGRTGLSEQEARDQGYDPVSALVAGHDAPHYYPLHGSLTLKLTAEGSSGRLLGAQVCGAGDGIKRLDVLGTAIKFGASLEDVANLDLGYAPPYSEAIDIAIHAANTLENKRRGLARGVSPLMVERMKKDGPVCFLDIREEDEVKAKPLQEQHVLVMPAAELRRRYREIPEDKPVVVFCGLGIRSYDAVCFLQSAGYGNVAYLEGGLSGW